jgi:hypothetical protein
LKKYRNLKEGRSALSNLIKRIYSQSIISALCSKNLREQKTDGKCPNAAALGLWRLLLLLLL